MKRIILDTDPGVDDALAFMLAFSSPEIHVEAVTTVDGNVNQKQCHENAKRLLEFLGRSDVPVACGAERPLVRFREHATAFHGEMGLGNAELPASVIESNNLPAAELIIEQVKHWGKDLTIVAIGPLTNIALALALNPDLPKKVDRLVIMGGAFNLTPYGGGNANAVAEFNIWHDPEAAKSVFESGIRIVCAGLDTTTHPNNRLSRTQFTQIESIGTRRSRLMVDLTRSIVDKYNGFSLHDPMALAYIIDPDLFETEKHHVEIETKGEFTEGMTIVDRRIWRKSQEDEKTEIITKVDHQKFLNLIMNRIPKED